MAIRADGAYALQSQGQSVLFQVGGKRLNCQRLFVQLEVNMRSLLHNPALAVDKFKDSLTGNALSCVRRCLLRYVKCLLELVRC